MLLEQPDLLFIVCAQMRSQGLTDGVSSSLWYGEENELVLVRNDHAVSWLDGGKADRQVSHARLRRSGGSLRADRIEEYF